MLLVINAGRKIVKLVVSLCSVHSVRTLTIVQPIVSMQVRYVHTYQLLGLFVAPGILPQTVCSLYFIFVAFVINYIHTDKKSHQAFCRVKADLLKGATGSADDDEYMKKQREMEEIRKKAEEEARAEAVRKR